MKLKRIFFTGVLVTFPTALTLFAFYWLARMVDSWGLSILRSLRVEKYIPDFLGVGLVGTIVIIFLMGLFVSNFVGQKLYALYISIFEKIPLINQVFSLFKKVFEIILSSDNQVFKRSVLLELPCSGTWMIGFLSLPACREIAEKVDSDLISVFVPTTPNPTSGVLVFVPKKSVVFLDMSIEDASKLIISGGIISPDNYIDAKPEV